MWSEMFGLNSDAKFATSPIGLTGWVTNISDDLGSFDKCCCVGYGAMWWYEAFINDDLEILHPFNFLLPVVIDKN